MIIDLIVLSLAIAFLYLGFRALELSTKIKSQTDPPSDNNQINTSLAFVSMLLMLLGGSLFYINFFVL